MSDGPFSIYNDKTKSFDLSHGFLSPQDPTQQLPKEFAAWEALAADLPKILTSETTRDSIANLPIFDISKLTSLVEFERAMLILSYLGHAYVWNNAKPIDHIPERLALPWYQVAKQLGRPPVLSYASYALYNWRRIDVNKPIELGNIVLLQNFLGGIDEEWFILIHVDIEAKAVPGVAALLPAQQAVNSNNTEALLNHLKTLANSIAAMCDTLDRMPEHCDPYIYFNRVRPYIHGWKDNPALPNGLFYEGVEDYHNQPQKFKGETGAQSAIIPAFDAALGIEHEDNPLKLHLNEMRDYMPPQHRAFIKAIESGASIRNCVLENFGSMPELRDTYNECINLIDRFRGTHFGYAAQYIQKQSQTSIANPTEVGTGGTPFMDYLRKHLEETREFLI